MYLIKSNDQYVSFSKKQAFLTTFIEKAHRFDPYSKAENFVSNNARFLWPDCSFEIVSFDEDYRETPITDMDFSGLRDTMSASLTEFDNFIQQTNTYLEYLGVCLSNVDKEVVDIEHKVEFDNLGVVAGYKMYKLLQDALLRRRDIKNEIMRMKAVIEVMPTTSLHTQYEKANKKVAEQRYVPRMRVDLFTA